MKQNGTLLPPELPPDFVAGNIYDKYRSRNILCRPLMQNFLRHARTLFADCDPDRVLEIGCGPGDLADRLLEPPARSGLRPYFIGTDISKEQVHIARENYPGLHFEVASACSLPYDADSFDTVVACEVFEHIDHPEKALAEVDRVCTRYLLCSVPWEPIWRIVHMLRGANLLEFGNTPGHIQHYSRRAFRRFVSRRFDIIEERHPFPWTMILARSRKPEAAER